MAVDMDKMEAKYEEFESKFAGAFKIEPDSTKWALLMQPHENMNGVPFIINMYHQRQLPADVKGAFSIRCQRDSYEDQINISKCYGCRQMMKYRKKKQVKDDKWDKKAGQYAPQRKPISQIIDITACFNKDGKFKRDLKKCFGNYGKEEGCDDCRFADSCEKFIQKWYMPVKAWKQCRQHFKDYGDLTDMKAAIPIRIMRTGKGLKSQYETTAFKDYKMELSQQTRKLIKEKLIDLMKEDPKPTGEKEELDQQYRDFYNLVDLSEDDDKKKDSKSSNKKDKKEKKNKDKEKNKKVDELRKRMREKARSGKLNRK